MDQPAVRWLQSVGERERFLATGRWAGQNVFELVDRWAVETGDKRAIADASREYSYRELRDSAQRAASVLFGLGLRPGSVLGAYLPSTALLAVLHLAVNRIGAVLLPMPDMWRGAEVMPAVTSARAAILVIPDADGRADYSAIADMAAACSSTPPIILTQSEIEKLIDNCDYSSDVTKYEPNPSRVALIITSSGSTGIPKLSALSNDNIYSHLINHITPSFELSSDDVIAAIAPANTGSTGYFYGVLCPLLIGATSVVLSAWAPDTALDLLVNERCTVAVTIPTQVIRMLPLLAEGSSVTTPALRTLITSGAAIPPDIVARAEARFGCRVVPIYGASEAGIPVILKTTDSLEKRRTTVGKVAPGQELRIIDETGADAPPGSAGELIWRGPNSSFGFWNQPELEARAWDADGWFHSGDAGVLDSDGYLRIVGRLKDMILRGGHNIFPVELEAILHLHPAVAEVAVVGVPDEVLGERTCAVVVSAGAEPPTLSSLTSYLEAKGVARYKLPEQLVVVSELPRAASSKLDKNQIRRIAVNAISSAALSPDA